MERPISYREISQALDKIISEPCMPLQEILDLKIKVQNAVARLGEKAPDWKDLNKPILCIDFDGVISEYRHGWKGPAIIEDTPVIDAFDFICDAVIHFTVMIFSTRCNFPEGVVAMREWFVKHHLPQSVLDQLIFEPGKPSWFLHIDDRALQFEGFWKVSAETIKNEFKPWYYSFPGWRECQVQSKENEPVIIGVDMGRGDLVFGNPTTPEETCPHGNHYDYCPVCSH